MTLQRENQSVMDIKVFILTFLFFGTWATSSFGQSSAQATMRVSVEVVKGVSIETSANSSFVLKDQVSELGSFVLRGEAFQNALINTSSSIELKNAKGEVIMMQINDERQQENDSFNINLKGSIDGKLAVKGIFKGQLSANIEYL